MDAASEDGRDGMEEKKETEKDRHFSERLGGDGERLEPGRGDRG
jgi:hypothetical protein